MISIKDIFVVIVVYKIEYQRCPSFLSLLNATQSIKGKLNLLIYDNSPMSNSIYNTEDINLTYVHDSNNPGVSKAYNVGVEIANKRECKYILFLDQDSKFDTNFLITMISTININPGKKLFAPLVMQDKKNVLISPSRYKNFRGTLIELPEDLVEMDLKDHSIINSGMVVMLNLFEQVGKFNEKIKLDFSDHEFIHRVSQNIDTLIIIPTKIHHSLSSMEKSSLESALYRYNSYLDGGRIFSKNINKKIIFLYISFARCILLLLKTKSFAFCKLFIKSIVK